MKKSALWNQLFFVLLTPSGALNCSLKGASTLESCDMRSILNQISSISTRVQWRGVNHSRAGESDVFFSIILWLTLKMVSTVSHLRDGDAHLLNSNRSFSKMRMGPVELRMMRGCPLKRQNTEPARAVPRKLSITPCRRRKHRNMLRRKKNYSRHDDQTSDETRGREGWRYDNDGACRESEGRVNECEVKSSL